MCSNRVYGRVCGRKDPLPNRWLRPHRERIIFRKNSWSTDVVALATLAHQGFSKEYQNMLKTFQSRLNELKNQFIIEKYCIICYYKM